MAAEPECRGWSVEYVFFPQPPPAGGEDGGTPRPGGSLAVSGRCTFPAQGYAAELRPHQPQPPDEHLLLDLVVREPSGSAAAGRTDVAVHYSAEMAPPATVTVLGYASLKVPIFGVGGP